MVTESRLLPSSLKLFIIRLRLAALMRQPAYSVATSEMHHIFVTTILVDKEFEVIPIKKCYPVKRKRI